MREAGEVVELKEGKAYLRFNRTAACSKCGACGMLAGKNEVTVEAPDTLGVQIGDRVEMEFSAKNAFQSTLIAYIFPLAMLFVGLWLGYVIPQTLFDTQDAFAAIMGIIFAAGSFLVLKLLNPVFQKKFANVYAMVRVVDANEPLDDCKDEAGE